VSVRAAIAVAVAVLGAVFVRAEMMRTAPPTQSQLATKPRSPATHLVPPSHSGAGRRIVFDQSDQRVWLVAGDGSTVRSYLVSGSTRDNVRPGSYVVKSRIRHARTYNGRGTFEYFVRFTQGQNAPIGFHSVTVDARGRYAHARADLGSPRTPGCVEQWHDDAKALWEFAPVGTPVRVVP